MTTSLYFAGLGLCSGFATAIVATETAPQQWTVLGLLAAVVLGIGGRMVFATEKNTRALSAVAKQLALFRQQSTNDRVAVLNKFERIPRDVADELQRRKSG